MRRALALGLAFERAARDGLVCQKFRRVEGIALASAQNGADAERAFAIDAEHGFNEDQVTGRPDNRRLAFQPAAHAAGPDEIDGQVDGREIAEFAQPEHRAETELGIGESHQRTTMRYAAGVGVAVVEP